MLKAIFFDLDNTLYDYDKPHKVALKEVYKILKKKISISYEKFINLYNLSKKEIHRELSGTASAHNRVLYFQRLVEKTHKTLDSKIILELYTAYWNIFLKNMKLRDGALDIFKYLMKRGIKIALVSDLTTDIQLRKIMKLGINKYVDILVTSEEAGNEKPHEIMFLLTLNKFDILPEEAVMVGDNSINDIEGGNSVGLTTILMTKKKKVVRKFKNDYSKPNYTVRTFKQLREVIEKIK